MHQSQTEGNHETNHVFTRSTATVKSHSRYEKNTKHTLLRQAEQQCEQSEDFKAKITEVAMDMIFLLKAWVV